MKKKLLIVILIVVIVFVSGWWIYNYQKDAALVGKEVEIIGTAEPGKICCRIVTECLHIEDGDCYYYFSYYKDSPYYVGEIYGKKVRMKAILNKTQNCYELPWMIKTQIGCQFYLEPIEIEVIE